MLNNRSESRSRTRLSRPCVEVLDRLVGLDGPASVETLAGIVRSHPNTVREHLATLSSAGFVERERAAPSGRGRPRWLYRTTPSGREHSPAYEGLARALVSQIERLSDDPQRSAIEAGERWGVDLAAQAEVGAGIRHRVLTVLDQLGFDPDPELADGRVRLRSCPMLGAAREHPDVVCSVHLGVVRGVVRSAGGDPDGVELLSFYEPDACHLALRPERPAPLRAVDNDVRGSASSR